MSVPISTFASNQLQPTARLTPVGRTSSTGLRGHGLTREPDAIVHLSDEAREILAGGLAPSEVTVFPARDLDEPAASPEATEADGGAPEAEAELIFGGARDRSEGAAAEQGRAGGTGASPSGFTRTRSPEEERMLAQLRARDVEVRAHEAAHAAVAGSLGGRPSLEYVLGPDGRRYAVAGEVSVDTSPGRTPEETITKARTIRAAATAPASPSAQDMAVASAAARMEAEAHAAIRERRQLEDRARAEHVSADAVPESVRRVDWSRVGRPGATEGPDPGAASSATVATAIAATTAPQAAPAAAAAPASTALPEGELGLMMLQLAREQLSSRGGMGHTHLSSGCGFCRRAASTYAYV